MKDHNDFYDVVWFIAFMLCAGLLVAFVGLTIFEVIPDIDIMRIFEVILQ